MKLFEIFGQFNLNGDEAVKEINKVEKAGNGLASKLGGIGKKVAGVGLAVGGAMAAATVAIVADTAKMATEFKQASNQMAAATGATTEEMEELDKSMKAVYANNFGENFEDIAQVMTQVKNNTSLVGEELEKATENAFLMRDTFDWDVERQLLAVDGLMKNFGLTSEEAYNMLAEGAQQGLDRNGDLLDMVNEYGVHFKDLGLSSEEMFAMMGKGAEHGVFQIEKMGDAMKEFGIRSKDGSDASMIAFEQLGMNGAEMTKAFNAGGDSAKKATKDVMKALANVQDKTKQNAIGVSLFGTMWEDLGADAVLAMGDIDTAIYDTSNALEEMNEIKYDDFGSAMEGIKRQIQIGLLDNVGEKLLPLMNQFANWLSDKIPMIVDGLGGVIDFLGNAISWVVSLFDNLRTQASDTSFFDNILNKAQEFLAGIKLFFDTMVAFATDFYNKNKEDIDAFLNALRQTIEVGIEFIKSILGALQAFWERYGDAFMDTAQKIFTFLIQGWTDMFSVIQSLFNAFASLFKGDWDGFVMYLGLAWETFLEFIKNAFTNIGPILKNIVLTILSILLDLFNIFGEDIGETFTSIWEGIKAGFGAVVDWIKQMWAGMTEFLSAPFENLGNAIENAKAGITGLGDKIAEGAKGVGDWVSEGIDDLVGNAEGTNYSTASRTLVGEKGPEIVELPTGSKVIPNSKIMGDQKQSGGDTTINNEFKIAQLVVREEADIKKVAKELDNMQKQKNRRSGLKPATA